MSTVYCTSCNRKASTSKYKRFMCDACHMAFVAGRKYGANEAKDIVIDTLKGEKK